MFWKLSFRQPSAIDTLLDKEDCTLSEILDEDDVIQECKAQNKKLIEFISRPEILEQLIGLISKEHDENEEDKVKFKYPHIACELLTSEVFAIVEQLSENEHLMALLWAFLDSAETLNPLIGSFISKVLAMLLNQKPSVIFEFMKCKEDFISLFLTHLGTSAMMDLLLQMVAAPDSDQIRLDLAVWLREQAIVERLVDFIGPKADPEQCGNASQALCDMIRLSREAAQMASPTPLLATLESEDIMQRLLDNMFSSESPSDVVIVHGIAVILTTLEKRPGNELGPAMANSFGVTDENLSTAGNAEIVEQLLTIMLPRVKDFHNLLTRRPNISPMVMTVGTLDPPLGNTRLQVVRLFSALLQCNETRISREIARLKTFCVLMDLFFQFPWNNFLHTQVEQCVTAAILSPVLLKNGRGKNEGEGGSEEQENGVSLRHHLLTDCQMVHRLLQGEELNNNCSQDSRGRRQGYMGHLVRITNRFVECGEGDEQLKSLMKLSLDEATQQRWDDFLSGPIADMNKKNETNLGGTRPMTSSMDESDEEFDQLGGGPDSELEKAYQVYQDVKYINPMVDDYGVDDALNPVEEPFAQTFTRLMEVSCIVSAEEEQSPAMFEAACNERIQQFDDSESDEEESSTWVEKDVPFMSHMDQQSPRSLSSDEDDEDSDRCREFPTSSSDDEDTLGKRAALYLATTSPSTLSKMTEEARQQYEHPQDPEKIELDHMNAISWRSEISTDEDLSGVVAMDTGGGIADWTKEPEPMVSSPSSSWADFTKFGQNVATNNTGPQDMELETALEPSNIVVTCTTSEEANRPPASEEMVESPERHDSSKYMRLSPSRSKNGEQQEPSSPPAPGSMLLSPSHNSESSSEDEGHTSSDSDEERSGTYALDLSTSSDGDPLLVNSPAQPAPPEPVQHDEEARSAHIGDADSPSRDYLTINATPTSHDTSHDTAANGVHETATAVTTITQNQSNKSEVEEHSGANRNSDSVGLNDVNPSESHQTPSSGGGERVNENSRQMLDGEVGEKDLHDNFSFLASQGLLSEGGNRKKVEVSDELTDERLIEEKRAEAMEACMRWEQTVQGPNDQTET